LVELVQNKKQSHPAESKSKLRPFRSEIQLSLPSDLTKQSKSSN
jgi:hypothetical protein